MLVALHSAKFIFMEIDNYVNRNLLHAIFNRLHLCMLLCYVYAYDMSTSFTWHISNAMHSQIMKQQINSYLYSQMRVIMNNNARPSKKRRRDNSFSRNTCHYITRNNRLIHNHVVILRNDIMYNSLHFQCFFFLCEIHLSFLLFVFA